MKVSKIEHHTTKFPQCDIATPTENFFVKIGNSWGLIHNSPAVIFGRDDSGEFILTDKHGFNAKRYSGRTKSPEALRQMLLSRGKGAAEPGRQQFADSMANIFRTFEAACPTDFRGFLFGDLLYYTMPPVENGKFVIKPNLVVYTVATDSELGQRIAQSNAGVVVHNYIEANGNKRMADGSELGGSSLMVMPPVLMQTPPQFDKKTISGISSKVKSTGKSIDALLDDNTLRSIKVSDFRSILYSYMNAKVKINDLTNLAGSFIDWLQHSKVSGIKQDRIKTHLNQHIDGFNAMFDLIAAIMQTKNDVIAQLDQHTSDVESYINGKRGGEGYVVGTGNAKLVNRGGFSAANMNKAR